MGKRGPKKAPPREVVEAVVRATDLNRIVSADPSHRYGRALGLLKAKIAAAPPGRHLDYPAEVVQRLFNQAAFDIGYLAGIEPDQPHALPIAPDDARLLVDTLCFRRGLKTRDDAWISLGISPNTGTTWLNVNRQGMKRWPAFAQLRRAALED